MKIGHFVGRPPPKTLLLMVMAQGDRGDFVKRGGGFNGFAKMEVGV